MFDKYGNLVTSVFFGTKEEKSSWMIDFTKAKEECDENTKRMHGKFNQFNNSL
jgi:hypothetical protein